MANKGRRIATAAGFVSGVVTCLDAIRDARETWPPDALWTALNRPHRLELCAGIVLILVTFVISIKQRDYP
jgi:hypothetical protein